MKRLFGMGCLLALAVLPSWSAPKPILTLERGACEKRCAVYSLTFFADGSVIYHGKHYVRRSGLVRSNVEPKKVEQLIEAFRDLPAPEETCAEMNSLDPSATVTYVSNSQSTTITHSLSCKGPVPQQWDQLERKVDALVNSRQWIR